MNTQPKTETSYLSLPFVCKLLGRMPNHVRKAAEDCGVIPAMTINNGEHFYESDFDRLRSYFEKKSKQD